MRIEGEDGWVELASREEEDAFEARASVGEFSAHNPKIWFRKDEFESFIDSLQRMARAARGDAKVEAMSSNEFELTVRLGAHAGHLTIEGLVGRLWYSGKRPHRLLLRFGFSLPVEALSGIVRDAARLTWRSARPSSPLSP